MPADTCPLCRKPIATDRDYDEIPEGEGEHLCWKAYGNCGAHDQYGSDEEMVLAAVQADRERTLEYLRGQASRHEETIWSEYDARCTHFYRRIAQELEQRWEAKDTPDAARD